MRHLVLLALLAACPGPRKPASATAPRLVVLLVVDQLPEWSFEIKRPQLHAGFDRLLAEGEWHIGRHPTAATLTAPGHALLGSGLTSAGSGILANEWWHRDLHRVLHATEDEDGQPTARWLRASGLADALAAAHTGGKAIAISLKNRASILPLGHTGTPIWYDAKTAAWAGLAAPPWLAEWNRSHPIAARLDEVWTPLDPARLAELSGVTDDQRGEVGEKGFGPTFPHDPKATKSPADTLFTTPLGDEVVLDTASEAIEREHLGADDAPDLLVISLSAYDLVGHGWGHESWEAWDMTLRLDQQLAKFLGDLDRLVGAGRWAMIVTSDHGASPLPERVGGGRLTEESIRVAANNAAAAVLGAGDWIDNADYPNIFLSQTMLAQPKDELASAEKRVLNALSSFPGIARVGRVADVAGHCDARTGDARALCLTFDVERSGDMFYLPASGWVLQDAWEPLATAHGSFNDYDRLVPVIVLAPGRTPHAPLAAPTGELPMTEIAPMLRRWLGV